MPLQGVGTVVDGGYGIAGFIASRVELCFVLAIEHVIALVSGGEDLREFSRVRVMDIASRFGVDDDYLWRVIQAMIVSDLVSGGNE